MKQFLRKFSKFDWITFVLCVVFVLLTVLPMTPVVTLGESWHTAVLTACAALTLSSVVIAQIHARELEKVLSTDVRNLQGLVRSYVDPNSVQEVSSTQIGHELEEMLASSTEWYFRGGSARWQRKAVLPKLAKITDRPVNYKVQVISPFEVGLCDKYARYRSKSQPGDPRGDAKRIRIELMSFIYATVVWQSRSKILAHITLLHRFSPFRLDGDSKRFLITVADLSKNGLRTSHGNWYHASLLDEFEFETDYATKLILPDEASDERGHIEVVEFFEKLRRLNQDAMSMWSSDYDESDWKEIFEIAGTRLA